MQKSSVSLVLRVPQADGKRTHHTAVIAANGRVKPLYGIVGGKPTHLPTGTYYLRYRQKGKRVWESAGSDPAQAQLKRSQRENLLEALELGLDPRFPNGDRLKAPPSKHLCSPVIVYDVLVREYASDVEMLHSRRTANQYQRDLMEFGRIVGNKLPSEITRADIQRYIRHLMIAGRMPKTIDNRLTTVRAFLRKQGETGAVLHKSDAPAVHKKIPHTYTKSQINALLAASSYEDRLIWEVFLSAGLREQELSHLTWDEVLFEREILHLQAKPDLKFALKDREERQIPLPTELLEKLKKRRALRPKDRLVFPTDTGKPDGHLLRRLKEIAFAAKLNCGTCTNRAGESCKTNPVCSKWQLHSFRRTAATHWHEAGLSVPSVQRLLGHSDVQTTMRYLTGQDLSRAEFKDAMNHCYAALSQKREVRRGSLG